MNNLDEDGSFAISKNAKSARYCDPVSGILKTGMFAVEGKEWYYTAATEAGSMAWETYTLNNRGSYSIKRTMTFSWDNNMKLGKFMDASTGKPVSADCICYYDASSTGAIDYMDFYRKIIKNL